MAAEARRRGPGVLLPAAGYILLDLALALLSHARPVLEPGISPGKPQAGLTVAFLIMYGPRLWPVTAAAALLSEALTSSSHVALPLNLAACLWSAMIYGALATLLRRLDLAGPLLNARAAGRFAG